MRALPLVVSLLLILAVLVYIGHGLKPSPEATAPAAEPPRYSVQGAHWLRLDRQGQPEFRAQAATIDYFRNDTARLTQLEVDALGGWSSPWRLQAPEGTARPDERRLLLMGDVLAYGAAADGTALELRTPRLWVDLLRRELHTDAPVQMDNQFRRATARGLKADFNGERIQLLNDVQMEYVPQG